MAPTPSGSSPSQSKAPTATSKPRPVSNANPSSKKKAAFEPSSESTAPETSQAATEQQTQLQPQPQLQPNAVSFSLQQNASQMPSSASRSQLPLLSSSPRPLNSSDNALASSTLAISSINTPVPAQAPTVAAFQDVMFSMGIHPLSLSSATLSLFKISLENRSFLQKPLKAIPKPDLIADWVARPTDSEFFSIKKDILESTLDQLLLAYDDSKRFGKAFFLCTTEESCKQVLEALGVHYTNLTFSAALADGGGGDHNADHYSPSRDESYPGSTPSTSQQIKISTWTSLGSDKEMEVESVQPLRNPIFVRLSRKRKEFRQASKLGDRDSHVAYIECRAFKDPNYEMNRRQLSVGVQAVAAKKEASAQSSWNRSVNFSVQYEPLQYTTGEVNEILKTPALQLFLESAQLNLEEYLQQNEMLDMFYDDYRNLGEDDITIEQGSHAHLQEYQSFTDLKHSKDKSISCIDWHPGHKVAGTGVIAVSCIQRFTFDERIDRQQDNAIKSSHILVWSFSDPIHPQLMLEAPDDIMFFKFCPYDSNLIVGGCINGQVILWDISDYQDKLRNQAKSRTEETHHGKEKPVETPVVTYVTVSSIEYSHRGQVSDITWLPQDIEVTSTGEVIENANLASNNDNRLFLTSSLDGYVLVWDLKYKKEQKQADLTWKPFLRIPISSIDNTFDYGCTRLSIRTTPEETKTTTTSSSSSTAVANSGNNHEKDKEKKDSEKKVSTKFYCSTEEGDLIYADWIADKNEEKGQASRVEHAFSIHSGSVVDLDRSPFFPDILLSVDGSMFHIFKEKLTTAPLLSSAYCMSYMTGVKWSPTRPGVFYISKADGTIEIWDLLDRSHLPSFVQNVSSSAITTMALHHYYGSGRSYHQFLAAGDDEGTLHILEVPKNLSKPAKNEKSFVKAFLEREIRRIHYTLEKKAAEANAASALAGRDLAKSMKAEETTITKAVDAKEEKDDDTLEKEYLEMEQAMLESFHVTITT